MSILVYHDKATATSAASTLIAAQIIERPFSVLGLDYSSELAPVYRTLSRMSGEGLLDWNEVTAFILAEQVEQDGDHSIARSVGTALLDRVRQPESKRFVPDTQKGDWSVVCNDFENQILLRGGLDLAFMCIRADGSVVYNFPANELAPVTHVERTEQGRIVTVGISTIMLAKKLVVMATGPNKTDAVTAALNGPIVPTVPASYLQLHPNASFILDEEAAQSL